MKIYRLRAVYDTSNLGFSDEGLLADGVVKARLVQQCELLIGTPKIAGLNREGKKNVDVNIDTHIFRGHPLLLELITTEPTTTFVSPFDIRPELESRIAELATVLAWSLQGAVGIMLADELCSRARFGFPTEWGFDDVVSVELDDYFTDIRTVASRTGNTRNRLDERADVQRSLAVTAMRWWRHARHTHSALDSFLAHWIVIEMFSDYISERKSIRECVEDAITTVFPALAQTDCSHRVRRMRDVMYSARCKCVHTGQLNLSNLKSVLQITAATAHACIKFMVDGAVSEPPEHVLHSLAI